jgi:hypothetical protein
MSSTHFLHPITATWAGLDIAKPIGLLLKALNFFRDDMRLRTQAMNKNV